MYSIPLFSTSCIFSARPTWPKRDREEGIIPVADQLIQDTAHAACVLYCLAYSWPSVAYALITYYHDYVVHFAALSATRIQRNATRSV